MIRLSCPRLLHQHLTEASVECSIIGLGQRIRSQRLISGILSSSFSPSEMICQKMYSLFWKSGYLFKTTFLFSNSGLELIKSALKYWYTISIYLSHSPPHSSNVT